MSAEELETYLARIAERQDAIRNDIAEMKIYIKAQQDLFVTQAEFMPVRNIVYGAVGLVLATVVTALVALVITNGGLP